MGALSDLLKQPRMAAVPAVPAVLLSVSAEEPQEPQEPQGVEPEMRAHLLAQEIRRVDGSHSLGAAALAEALMPFVAALQAAPEGEWVLVPRALCVEVEDQLIDLSNCKAGQRDYRPREREFDSDILRRFREAAAPSPSAALQAGS